MKLRLFWHTGEFFWLDAKDVAIIDIAMDDFIRSGGSRDALLYLNPIEGNGAQFRCLVSAIAGYYLSTDESEARVRELAHESEVVVNTHYKELEGPEWAE